MRALAVGMVVASMVVGCSSPLTIDEYVAGIEGATDAYVSESQSLSYDYQSTVEDGVRDIAAASGDDTMAEAVTLVTRETVAYLAVLSDAMRRYLDAIDVLDAPSTITDAHGDYVEGVRFVLGAIPATREAVETARDLESVQLALTSSGFADGQVRWTITCTNLEQAVRDEGTGIDLGCTRPETSP